MTLYVKDGKLLTKDGGLAPSCDCCGGGWFCFEACCPDAECAPVTLASWVHDAGDPCVNIGAFETVGARYCGRPWRFVERGVTCNGSNNDGVLTWYDYGTVSPAGKLVGLYPWGIDEDFCFDYPYTGYLYLEIGCAAAGSSDPFDALWPGCTTVPPRGSGSV